MGDDIELGLFMAPTQKPKVVANQEREMKAERFRKKLRNGKNEKMGGERTEFLRYEPEIPTFEEEHQDRELLQRSKPIWKDKNNQRDKKPLKQRQQGKENEDIEKPEVLKPKIIPIVEPDLNDATYFEEDLAYEDHPEIAPNIKKALKENKFIHPTKIQAQALPYLLRKTNPAGEEQTKNAKDKIFLIRSETGSGKTLSYLIPIINELLARPDKINRSEGAYALVICPTRELCQQVMDQVTALVKRCIWIIVGMLVGGENINHEKARLRKGLNIVIATPGRIAYHLQSTTQFKMENLKYLVFEEYDRTLDMGFKKEIAQIMKTVQERMDVSQLRILLVSAIFTRDIKQVLEDLPKTGKVRYIGFEAPDKKWTTDTKPEEKKEGKNEGEENNQDEGEESNEEEVKIDITQQDMENTRFKIPAKLRQHYCLYKENDKIAALLMILVSYAKRKTVIFVSTRDEVEFLASLLPKLPMADHFDESNIFRLHGDVPQKERATTFSAFNKEPFAILIATDVASRGLDFNNLYLIIQFDPPGALIDYINRIGRTARRNAVGESILMTTRSELSFVRKLSNNGFNINEIPFDEMQQVTTSILSEDDQANFISFINFARTQVKRLIRSEKAFRESARNAFNSMIRAYSRLKDKECFRAKKLHLGKLTDGFGLSEVKSKGKVGPSSTTGKGREGTSLKDRIIQARRAEKGLPLGGRGNEPRPQKKFRPNSDAALMQMEFM